MCINSLYMPVPREMLIHHVCDQQTITLQLKPETGPAYRLTLLLPPS